MSLRKYVLVFLILFCYFSFPITAQEVALKNTVYQVVAAFKNKDIKALNALIHPKFGYFQFISPGAYLGYIQDTSIETDEYSESIPYQGVSGAFSSWGKDFTHLKLKKKKLTVFEGFCEAGFLNDYPEEQAILISRLGIDHPFYEFINTVRVQRKEFFPELEAVSAEFMAKIKKLDRKTLKIEVYNSTQWSMLSFYLTFIDGKWYFIAIDGVICGDA